MPCKYSLNLKIMISFKKKVNFTQLTQLINMSVLKKVFFVILLCSCDVIKGWHDNDEVTNNDDGLLFVLIKLKIKSIENIQIRKYSYKNQFYFQFFYSILKILVKAMKNKIKS